MSEMILGWEDKLDEPHREMLEWMRTHKANVYLMAAPEDTLHDLPREVVLEVLLDKHGVFKLRGHERELGTMIEHAYATVQNVFDFIRNR
ncbi:hypothetical protein [Deinococcus yavapaiensis]|uniref:Uncharacterized protein n=1 Tax=Deinococcus yavapaiensis KR-236 TaxID=694435 RepID=A0A318SHX1_9DEIO|nr:hypothetical protein [Deinococcus yavapaiensis]PYE50972.1 hypothetical protein DES52_11639 [Deinococcus yavapaiensis KR-236]